MMIRRDLVEGKRITVLGMARSGMAAAQLVRKHGAEVFVSEVKTQDKLIAEIALLHEAGILFETGGHTARSLQDVDFVIVSPGINPHVAVLQEIDRRGLPAFSEIEVTSWLCPATMIAITGTNGKSTTTALMAHLLNSAGRKAVATGNIGSPFADDVGSLTERDYAVVEISSFQLERTDTFRPKVATILNITPDHLDRYTSFAEYCEMKCRIADSQQESDFLILNADDMQLVRAEFWGKPQIVWFSTKQKLPHGVYLDELHLSFKLGERSGTICPTAQVGIPGPHNLANAAAAAAMALAVDLTPEQIAAGLLTFKGIPHRLEHVTEWGGVNYVNDSKATNVDSVYYALQSVPSPIILIMGGRDKGGTFEVLAELVSARVKLLLLIGEATDKIATSLGSLTTTLKATDLFEALRLAHRFSTSKDTVLLSPGCASFDQFRDFEDRGDKFKEAVLRMKKEVNGC